MAVHILDIQLCRPENTFFQWGGARSERHVLYEVPFYHVCTVQHVLTIFVSIQVAHASLAGTRILLNQTLPDGHAAHHLRTSRATYRSKTEPLRG